MAAQALAAALLALATATTVFAAERPRIAVVIDDFGLTYEKNVPDEAWYALKFPVTFAVMPQSPRTKEAAKRTKQSGHELIIHFPFDPFLQLDLPKDKASESDLDKVRKLMEKAFQEIPQAVGLNNHRSYRATMNRPLMQAVMPLIKARGVYFLDSGVSPKTVAYEEARKAAVPALKNVIFLEEPKHYSKEFAMRFLRAAAAHARKHGSAVVIGHHYFHGTYEALVEEVPKLQAEGFEFVFASALLPR